MEPTFCNETHPPREHCHYQRFNKNSSHYSLWATSRIQNDLNSLEWQLNIINDNSCLGFKTQSLLCMLEHTMAEQQHVQKGGIPHRPLRVTQQWGEKLT